MTRQTWPPSSAAQRIAQAPACVLLELRAGGLLGGLGRLESRMAGMQGERVVAFDGDTVHEGSRAEWLTRELGHWQRLADAVRSTSVHLLVDLVPEGVSLGVGHWQAVGSADLLDRVDLLLPVAASEPAVRVRELGTPWRACNESESLLLLAALPVTIVASLTVVVAAGGARRRSRQVTWLLCRDGWREVRAGAPDVVQLVRRHPSVLASRIDACLPRNRGAAG